MNCKYVKDYYISKYSEESSSFDSDDNNELILHVDGVSASYRLYKVNG